MQKPRDFLQLLLDAQMEENLGKVPTVAAAAVAQEDDEVTEHDHYDLGSNLKPVIKDSVSRKKGVCGISHYYDLNLLIDLSCPRIFEDIYSVLWCLSIAVLTEEAVVSHSLLFLLAGFDTTATTISFATYFMALNPDCQEKLVTEIDETMEKYVGWNIMQL